MKLIDKKINIRAKNYILGTPKISYTGGLVFMYIRGEITWWTPLTNIMLTIEQ